MSRIRKAYEARFRSLLQQVGGRKLDKGVQWFVTRARHAGEHQGVPLADALTQTYEALAAKPQIQKLASNHVPHRFFCDAGLGGLARWLRAAGYEAFWEPGIDDDVLLQKARNTATTILTTDSMLMERRLLRDRILPALWLPPTLTIPGQLSLVFREFGLTVRETRCMACGGKLLAVDKEAVRERIPPKTYRWLNHFFICAQCGQLFWHGTHWLRIRGQLESIAKTAPGEASPSQGQSD